MEREGEALPIRVASVCKGIGPEGCSGTLAPSGHSGTLAGFCKVGFGYRLFLIKGQHFGCKPGVCVT